MTDIQGSLKPVKIYSFSYVVQTPEGTGQRTRYLIVSGDINTKIIEERIIHFRKEEREKYNDSTIDIFCLNVSFMSDAMMDTDGKLIYPRGVLLGITMHVPFEVPYE